MTKAKIVTAVTNTVDKVGYQLKKHSPEILVVAGVVGGVVSAVMACKATTKASDILNDAHKDIESIHEVAENPEYVETYTAEDKKKDLALVYFQTGVKLAKLYAPSVALGAMSIASILASNNIMRKRNVALTAAYATVTQNFSDYRGRVLERFGEKVDKELLYNIKAKKIEEVIVDEETGKEKKVKKTVDVTDGHFVSQYARVYDDGNEGWEPDAESNMLFLRAEQNYWNDKLRTRKYVFLNEIYERLNFPPSEAGQYVGWIYDPENPNHKGNNYIDFGLYDITREKVRDFINGYEKVILLDFNVDGVISDKLEKFLRTRR